MFFCWFVLVTFALSIVVFRHPFLLVFVYAGERQTDAALRLRLGEVKGESFGNFKS